ncbi:MAG TPA: hypothetical protein VIG41_09800, partial [Micrococcaceae bacterium]
MNDNPRTNETAYGAALEAAEHHHAQMLGRLKTLVRVLVHAGYRGVGRGAACGQREVHRGDQTGQPPPGLAHLFWDPSARWRGRRESNPRHQFG